MDKYRVDKIEQFRVVDANGNIYYMGDEKMANQVAEDMNINHKNKQAATEPTPATVQINDEGAGEDKPAAK